MKEAVMLFKGEVKRSIILQKRYFLSFITDISTYYLLFMGMYFLVNSSSKHLSKEELSTMMSIHLIGYISWYFFSFTMTLINNGINRELSLGTFEQLCMSHNSILKIWINRLFVQSIRNFIFLFPLIGIIILSTGVSLKFNLYTLLVALFMYVGILGFSFLLGGLSIKFKRIGQLPFLIGILFLGSTIIDYSALPNVLRKILFFLPFSKGIDMIKSTVATEFVFSFSESGFLLLNSLFYLFLGLMSFSYFYNRSLKDGDLSTY